MSKLKTYKYRPGLWAMLLVGLLFGAAAVFFFLLASTNERDLLLNDFIHLNTFYATIFYWVFFIVSAGFVFVAIVGIISRYTLDRKIILGIDQISLPKTHWSSEHQTISFADIVRVEIIEASGQKFAHIYHAGGKANITASMLPKNKDFEEIMEILNKSIENNNNAR